MKLRLLSLFSGIGAFEKALGDKVELVNYCEIDKYAAKAYSLIHNVPEDLNLKDVTKVDTSKLHNIDMVTYGFPCQDISNAGKRQGFVDCNGNRTRSGLFFEALRIIKDTQPKYAIAENVKNLVSKKFKTEFETVISELDKAGYVSYYDVLNAKDYGIPQNRERIFIISIRKDVDNGSFVFPKPFDNGIRLKDVLQPESEIEDKYYLSEEYYQRFKESQKSVKYPSGNKYKVLGTTVGTGKGTNSRHWVYDINEYISTIDATTYKQPKQILVNSENGLSPTLDTCNGGNRMPKIVERMTKQAYETLQENECNAGDVINPFNKKVVNNGLCPTLTTRPEGFKTANLIVTDNTNDFRIRKLTPKECWRLMGFEDTDFWKVKNSGISNSQLYKMAGNSIVVNVLRAIFRELLNE